jgi:hypothetical protein
LLGRCHVACLWPADWVAVRWFRHLLGGTAVSLDKRLAVGCTWVELDLVCP